MVDNFYDSGRTGTATKTSSLPLRYVGREGSLAPCDLYKKIKHKHQKKGMNQPIGISHTQDSGQG